MAYTEHHSTRTLKLLLYGFNLSSVSLRSQFAAFGIYGTVGILEIYASVAARLNG